MSNELTLTTDATFDQIALLTGQQTGQARSSLAKFTINRDFDTPEGKQIPPGTYKISDYNGKPVYSKTAKFRPYINAFQYIIYDAATNTFPNKTVLFKNFSEEAIDEKGGVKCGKLAAKQKNSLTEAQVEAQKKIKCTRHLFGLVSMKGTDEDGKDILVENHPVLWKSTGSAFMPVSEVLQVLTKAQRPYFQAEIDMGIPVRQKNGSTVYFIPNMTANMKDVKAIDEADILLLKEFQATIDFENSQVIEKYKKAKIKAEVDDIAEEIIESGYIQMHDDPVDL